MRAACRDAITFVDDVLDGDGYAVQRPANGRTIETTSLSTRVVREDRGERVYERLGPLDPLKVGVYHLAHRQPATPYR